MDSIHAICLRHADNFFYVEVGFQRLIVFADLISFVRFVAVKRIAVFISENGNGAQTQF